GRRASWACAPSRSGYYARAANVRPTVDSVEVKRGIPDPVPPAQPPARGLGEPRRRVGIRRGRAAGVRPEDRGPFLSRVRAVGDRREGGRRGLVSQALRRPAGRTAAP